MYILWIGTKLVTTIENITGIACRVGVIIEAEQWFVLDRLDVNDFIWLLHWKVWVAQLFNKNYNFRIVWPRIVTNSLWIKPTDALNYNFIGITTLHVSGSLSAHHQEFLAAHRHWYILCSFDDRCDQFDDCLLPGAGWKWNDHQNCIKCTNADVQQRTPDDGQKGCPKHVDS
jgi:hypothetical protein